MCLYPVKFIVNKKRWFQYYSWYSNKGNAKDGVSTRLQSWPDDLDLWPWPWKSIEFQILCRTKHVPSLVKIHWRMLILECSQGCYGRKDGRTVTLLYPFVGEGIIMCVLVVSIFLFLWLSIGFWKCSESIIFVFCNFILLSNLI
jgi:hypothetical protein